MRTLLIGAALFTMSLSGCHMCRLSNTSYNVVDDVTDAKDFSRGLDGVYCERLDVTRWGMNQCCPRSSCPHCR